jgi:hypothetical protein
LNNQATGRRRKALGTTGRLPCTPRLSARSPLPNSGSLPSSPSASFWVGGCVCGPRFARSLARRAVVPGCRSLVRGFGVPWACLSPLSRILWVGAKGLEPRSRAAHLTFPAAGHVWRAERDPICLPADDSGAASTGSLPTTAQSARWPAQEAATWRPPCHHLARRPRRRVFVPSVHRA